MTEFAQSYAAFLDKLGGIASKNLKRRSEQIEEADKLVKMLSNLVGESSDEHAQQIISFAASQITPATRERLLIEMNYFNKLDSADEEDGDTVKGSLEDLLGNWLPDWLKDNLKILNEILSLARGGG